MSGSRLDTLAAALRERLGRDVERRFPLSRCSTYRLGGPAELFLDVGSAAELVAVADALVLHPAPLLVVGRGSNLLVTDEGFPGLAVRLTGEFELLEVGERSVTAGAAVPLPVLARRSAGEGAAGLEFYVGIPGTVGGAVRMNAGGHGRETAEVLERAWTLDLAGGTEEVDRSRDDLRFAYRSSAVGETEVVTRAEFHVVPDDVEACDRRVSEIVRWRREHQPGGSNAGSVFTNPPGDSAGRIIDACGLKGFQVGGAVVSPKHANFFQAEDSATARDVRDLVVEVQRRVEEATGVRLEPEITLVGFPEPGEDPGGGRGSGDGRGAGR